MNKNLSLAKELIKKLDLPMKVFSVEENEEGILTFHFSSESKVDLRDLVKKIQERVKRKIVMHQAGPRDEVKFLAGVGPCGRRVCCSFLKTPSSFSSPFPAESRREEEKIGLCGKSLCCLQFEEKKTEVKEKIPLESITEKLAEPIPPPKETLPTPPRRILRILPRKKSRHRR